MAETGVRSLRRLLEGQKLCAVAMAHDPAPHVAVVTFLHDAAKNKIYLITHRDTRKFWLMRHAGRASLLFDNRGEASPGSPDSMAATLIGTVRVVPDGEAEPLKARLVKRVPGIKPLAEQERCAVIEFTPCNCRLTRGLERVEDFSLDGGPEGRDSRGETH